MRGRAVAYQVGLAIFLVCVVVILSFPQSSGAQWVQTGGPEGGAIEALTRARDAVRCWLESGVERTMNEFNKTQEP